MIHSPVMGPDLPEAILASYQSQYNVLTEMYDVAEEMLSPVPLLDDEQLDHYLDITEPFVEEIGETMDNLTDLYIEIAAHHHDAAYKASLATRVETGLRKMFSSVKDFRKKLGDQTAAWQAEAAQLAERCILAVKRKTEEVMVIFANLINLSLDRIMSQKEAQKVLERHGELSSLLHHQLQLGQS